MHKKGESKSRDTYVAEQYRHIAVSVAYSKCHSIMVET